MKRPKKSNHKIASTNEADYALQAATVIQGGGLVAIPTETYYGIATDPFNEAALHNLYEVKQRPFEKPVLVLIDKFEQLKMLVSEIPDIYIPLINKYWPGPLTLIFPALASIPPVLTGGTSTVGIRFSSSNVANKICHSAGGPITATSANLSGMNPASCVDDIVSYFGDVLDLIVDGGKSRHSLGSTVVGLRGKDLQIIRSGMIKLS